MTGGYGGADILHGCTIAVEKGEIAVIVGPNGAGKSTAMKAVFGMLKLRQGRAAGGRGYHRADPAGARGQGHGLRAADHNIFTSMTVEENLEMGAFLRRDDIRDHDGAGL
jgi:branched-chain amino acid transport system ATP-binding protein